MRKILIAVLLVVLALGALPGNAQQIPFLSELFSRYEEFNRIYAEKGRGGEKRCGN